jgi:tetratricopeptide (TPR) repeat protein/tRNA A-37 threonylcarbamoyl transferase component Bud32
MKIGQQVAHYKILERLGEGGMGVVYKARDTRLGRIVALKFFRPGLLADGDSRSHIVREARAASALDHPSICTIHGIDDAGEGRLFICMGYCEGRTLRDRMRDPGFGFDERLDTAVQIAEGLAHAHRQGIVHRDMKPENVMIGEDGRARIMDFGLAKMVGQTTVLRTGTVAGTLFYMSPEQIRGGTVDQRSDVWSLGAMLYELMAGRPPHAGDYEAAVLYSIANERPVSPSEVRPGVSPELERIALKALEKKPEDRYQSMEEMVEDLSSIRSGAPGKKEDPGAVLIGRSASTKTRRRMMYAALVSIAVIASALVVGNQTRVDTAPVSVAVLDFENSWGEEGIETVLSNLLTTDLAQTPNVRVLGRERMLELQERLGMEKVDESRGFDLAKAAGVQVLISGKVLRMGDAIRLDASVYDVGTKNLLFARSEKGNKPDDLFDMVDDLSRGIRKGIKVLPWWKITPEPSLSTLMTPSLEAYKLYTKGEELRDSDPKQAVAFMEQAVAQDTTFAVAHMELALLYNHQLGDPQRALQHALKAKQLCADKSPKEYLKSLIYESWVRGNWDSVIDYMRRYLELQPNDMRIQRRLGWVLARRESTYAAAIMQFESMVEMDPQNISGEISSAYNHLGNLRMYMGNYDGAIDAFEHYKELSPGGPAPLHSIGNAYLLSGRYEEAVDEFLEILKEDPKFYISCESLGMAYLAMGKWRDALTAFRRYLAAAPRGLAPYAHVRMADVYCIQKDYDLASKEVEEALELDPSCAAALWKKGLIALAWQGSAGAEADLDSLSAVLREQGGGAEEPRLHHLRGRLRLAQGQGDEGLRELHLAASSATRGESYYFDRELVRGSLDAGHPEEAVEEAAVLLKRNPNDGELLSILGAACERIGDRERMRSYFSRAVAVWDEADRDFAPLKTAQAKL